MPKALVILVAVLYSELPVPIHKLVAVEKLNITNGSINKISKRVVMISYNIYHALKAREVCE